MGYFLCAGAPLPGGVNQIRRWHGSHSTCGCLLVKGSVEAAYVHTAEWADLLEMAVILIVEDS